MRALWGSRIVIWITIILVLFPVVWIVMSSFSAGDSFFLSSLFPEKFSVEHYVTLFRETDFTVWVWNSLKFCVIVATIQLVITSLAAYAFARLKFKGKNIVFTLFLSLMMIPNELVVITNFVTITNWNLRNTFMGLILPSITSVFYIYLLKENFEQVPEELYKAAKVDGLSDWEYLWKVLLPVCSPTVVTITILKVIECWNSYVWPRLITDNEKYYLVSNGIQEIRENGFGRENIPAMMAAVVVISIPLIILFLLFHNIITDNKIHQTNHDIYIFSQNHQNCLLNLIKMAKSSRCRHL